MHSIARNSLLVAVMVSAACVPDDTQSSSSNARYQQQQPPAQQQQQPPPQQQQPPPATQQPPPATQQPPPATQQPPPANSTIVIPTVIPGVLPNLVIPNVCIPVGTWSKKYDFGFASGTVEISPPVLFNQFPIKDGVTVGTTAVGTLQGLGQMTSANDLSVDVTNLGYVLSYTCNFGGAHCSEGSCKIVKGGLGGFKLVKVR